MRHKSFRTAYPVFTAIITLLVLVMPVHYAQAWSEHPLISYPVLRELSDVRDAEPVSVEDLDSFLLAEEKGLLELLSREEAWAREHLAWYLPAPDALAFRATGNTEDLRRRFFSTIRINPDVHFDLYLQVVPGRDSPAGTPLTPEGLTFLKNTSDWKDTRFVSIEKGESVRPLDVVVTATDEPDFGLDIGLFKDNGTWFGEGYNFGTQPFGNPNLEYSSQGPFHMGYYHEAGIVNAMAGFVKKTYPEYRIHLYQSLSRFAFETGHDYWGWRFMGIGLHYVMDLTQPYHTTLLPGVGTLEMLWVNALDLVGIRGPMEDAIQIVSNRHTALEKFEQLTLRQAYESVNPGDPVLVKLRTMNECPVWDDRMPRNVISAQSNNLADETDRLIEESMPALFVSDPDFELGTSPELENILAGMGHKDIENTTALMARLLEHLPGYICSYVKSILPGQE